MMNNQLKQILYEYANTKGVGMPLTAEEMLNAISNWLVTVLPECIDIETTTLAAGAEATATLTGSGTPDDHYVLKLGIPQGATGPQGPAGGESGATGITLSGASGTLTAEQLQTLEASVLNYIVYDNEIYTLADNEATAGYYTYSHCGIQNNSRTFIKCITITIASRAYILARREVEQKSRYEHVVRGISTGNYAYICNIPADVSGRFNPQTLSEWLTENGYTSENNLYPARGIAQTGTNGEVMAVVVGIYSSRSGNLAVYTYSGAYGYKSVNVTVTDDTIIKT